MADYRQLSLFGEDDDPNQLSLPLDFEPRIPSAAELLRMGDAGRPIAPEGGDFDMIDLSEEDDTEPDQAPGPAAILSVVPTSTTNPQRPRTLAAGYDHHRKTITVVFRDGTLWNYYGCSMSVWTAFKRAPSKGVFIRLRLDPMDNYGPADASDSEQAMASAIRGFASRIQSSGRGGNRIGYQFHPKQSQQFSKAPKGLPAPTYSQRRYREEIRRLMDQGRSATEAVLEARRNLENKTRRR